MCVVEISCHINAKFFKSACPGKENPLKWRSDEQEPDVSVRVVQILFQALQNARVSQQYDRLQPVGTVH